MKTMVVLKVLYSYKSDRLFYMYGDINARNCADISYDITLINFEDDRDDEIEKSFVRKPIRIYINSFGESVYDMWLLVDTILKSETPVYIYCNSCAISALFRYS